MLIILEYAERFNLPSMIILLTFLKSSEAELRAINDISLALRSFYIKSSKWSMDLPEGNCEILFIFLSNFQIRQSIGKN